MKFNLRYVDIAGQEVTKSFKTALEANIELSEQVSLGNVSEEGGMPLAEITCTT